MNKKLTAYGPSEICYILTGKVGFTSLSSSILRRKEQLLGIPDRELVLHTCHELSTNLRFEQVEEQFDRGNEGIRWGKMNFGLTDLRIGRGEIHFVRTDLRVGWGKMDFTLRDVEVEQLNPIIPPCEYSFRIKSATDKRRKEGHNLSRRILYHISIYSAKSPLMELDAKRRYP